MIDDQQDEYVQHNNNNAAQFRQTLQSSPKLNNFKLSCNPFI